MMMHIFNPLWLKILLLNKLSIKVRLICWLLLALSEPLPVKYKILRTVKSCRPLPGGLISGTRAAPNLNLHTITVTSETIRGQ